MQGHRNHGDSIAMQRIMQTPSPRMMENSESSIKEQMDSRQIPIVNCCKPAVILILLSDLLVAGGRCICTRGLRAVRFLVLLRR